MTKRGNRVHVVGEAVSLPSGQPGVHVDRSAGYNGHREQQTVEIQQENADEDVAERSQKLHSRQTWCPQEERGSNQTAVEETKHCQGQFQDVL